MKPAGATAAAVRARTSRGDIVSGSAGTFNATSGWDFVTGIGSTLSLAGK